MAVIKCSNCENEILDNEVVCPYCDCPLSETIKKMKKEDLKSFSDKSVDKLTGKIPVINDELIKEESDKNTEEPKLATSSDFEKEKAAILKDIGINPEEKKAEESKEADLGKTLKISREEILGGKVNTQTSSATLTKQEKRSQSSRTSSQRRNSQKQKTKNYSKYIVIAVTILGIFLIISLVSKITNSISDSINSRKKTNKTVEVQSSAEAIEKLQGFRVIASTLEITDKKAMLDDNGKSYTEAKDYPWYDYKDTNGDKVEINHVTVYDGVESIGPYAFAGYTKLKTVKLPASVSHIDDKAFYGCTALTDVIFHDASNLTEIGDSAFENCSKLENIAGYTKEGSFELELAAIGDRAFAGCKSIKEFRLPDDVSIGDEVFADHNEEFAIICSEDSEAYEYATKNEIPVKEDFEERIIENEVSAEEENDEETQESSSGNEPENGNEENSDQGENNPPASNQPTLEDLQNQLSQAQTPEEKEAILEEIANLQ